MAVSTKLIDYNDGDTSLEGFFAFDDTQSMPMPTVLICHAWGGRDDFVCEKAKKLTELGYAGFALDMYGKGVLGSGPEENATLMQPFMDDRGLLQRRISVALKTVRDLNEVDSARIAAIGFCFGGLCVLDLARTGADLKGVISFHGLLSPPGNTGNNEIKAKVLVMHGYDDPMVPNNDVIALQDELTKAKADWQFHSFGNTMHAFTNPIANDPSFGTVYNSVSDNRSWQTMQNFLDEILG